MLLKLLVWEKMSFWARGLHLVEVVIFCAPFYGEKDKKILWSCMNKKAKGGLFEE